MSHPCIDLHGGKVKQIVSGALGDTDLCPKLVGQR